MVSVEFGANDISSKTLTLGKPATPGTAPFYDNGGVGVSTIIAVIGLDTNGLVTSLGASSVSGTTITFAAALSAIKAVVVIGR